MANKPWERPKKKPERSSQDDEVEALFQNLPPDLQWLKTDFARLQLSPNDPIIPILKVILQCSTNMGSLPTLSREVNNNLRDFKAAVYDVRKEADRLAHLLQRKLGGVHQMPVSRAMWACGTAGCIGMLLGLTTMSGLVFFAIHHDCNLNTLECPKLQLKLNR